MEAGSAGFDGKFDVEGDGDVKDGSQGFCLTAGGPAKLGVVSTDPVEPGAAGRWHMAGGLGDLSEGGNSATRWSGSC